MSSSHALGAALEELLRALETDLARKGLRAFLQDGRGTVAYASPALAPLFQSDGSHGFAARIAHEAARVLAGETPVVELSFPAGECASAVQCCRLSLLALGPSERWLVGVVRDTAHAGADAAGQQRLLEHAFSAREEERAQLADEIHDTIAQTLTSLSMHAEVLSDVIQHGIVETRGLLNRLRPPELASVGLETSLRTLLEDTPGVTGRVGSTQAESGPEMGERLRLVFYRVAQTLLDHTRKAGGTWDVALLLSASSTEFALELQSAERPLPSPADLMRALSEPIEAVGGRVFRVDRPERRGTVLRVAVPRRLPPE